MNSPQLDMSFSLESSRKLWPTHNAGHTAWCRFYVKFAFSSSAVVLVVCYLSRLLQHTRENSNHDAVNLSITTQIYRCST